MKTANVAVHEQALCSMHHKHSRQPAPLTATGLGLVLPAGLRTFFHACLHDVEAQTSDFEPLQPRLKQR